MNSRKFNLLLRYGQRASVLFLSAAAEKSRKIPRPLLAGARQRRWLAAFSRSKSVLGVRECAIEKSIENAAKKSADRCGVNRELVFSPA
jgi:hypothetical protein